MKTFIKNRTNQKIEQVCGVIIENLEGKILLARSPKWNNKWTLPGGHLDDGETVQEAAVREGQEETGLRLAPVALIAQGELIDSKDFYRPAHFQYHDWYCTTNDTNVTLEKRELTEYRWIDPQDALKLDLAESFADTIKKFIEYKNNL